MTLRPGPLVPLRMLAKVAPEAVVQALERQELREVNANGDLLVDGAAMRAAAESLSSHSQERAYAEKLAARMASPQSGSGSSRVGVLAGQADAVVASVKSALEVVAANAAAIPKATADAKAAPSVEAKEPGIAAHSDAIKGIVALGNGFVTGSSDNSIKLWRAGATTPDNTLAGHEREVTSIARMPDGRVASSSGDGSVKVWNPSTGWCDQTLKHKYHVAKVVALEGGYLVTQSTHRMSVWKANERGVYKCVCRMRLEARDNLGSLVALSGTRFAVAGAGGTLRIMDAAKARSYRLFDRSRGALLARIDTGAVANLTALPGDRLAWRSRDKVFVCDPERKTLVALPGDFSASVYGVAALSNDRLAISLAGGAVEVWDLKLNTRVATDTTFTTAVVAMAELADGQLVSATNRGRLALSKI